MHEQAVIRRGLGHALSFGRETSILASCFVGESTHQGQREVICVNCDENPYLACPPLAAIRCVTLATAAAGKP